MGQRIDLHTLLRSLGVGDKVYYQPPEGFKLSFPCIVYNLSDKPTRYANDRPYGWTNFYELTYISRTPDDDILDRIGMLVGSKFDRMFIVDNLYHYVYTLFY